MKCNSVSGLLVFLSISSAVPCAAVPIGQEAASTTIGNSTVGMHESLKQATETGRAPQHIPQPRDALKDEFGLPFAPVPVDLAAAIEKAEQWKREAARHVLRENPEELPQAIFGAEKRSNQYGDFTAALDEARVPDCLHKDGLKRQPPRIGFFVFEGVLGLPFVVLAKARGKCQ